MCVVSMVGDHFNDRFRKEPDWQKYFPSSPVAPTPRDGCRPLLPIDREEFDRLKKQVEEMHELLRKAKQYDESTNQSHCEMEDKVALLKHIAKQFGVDMKDVFPYD